jgi:hypothetical protein
MMDINAFPAGTPLEELPAFNVSECEAMPGGLVFAAGFNIAALQLLAPNAPHALVWPCPIFAVTDGKATIAAVMQNHNSGVAELVMIPNGLKVTRPMIRKAYQTCIELHMGGVFELLVYVPPGKARMRRRLRRFGFVRVTEGEDHAAAVYRVFTSEFLSPAARRRLRMKLN